MLVEDILHDAIAVAISLQLALMLPLTNRQVLRRPNVEPLVSKIDPVDPGLQHGYILPIEVDNRDTEA